MSFAIAALTLLAHAGPPLASAAPAAWVQETRMHEDARNGFKFRPPKDWSELPVKVDEKLHVAQYVCPRAYFWTDKAGGWTREHKPLLTVIAFAAKPNEPSDAFQSYVAYVERTHTNQGCKITGNERAEVEGTRVHQLEIQVNQVGWGGPGRLVTWIFDAPDLDLAVQFEMYDDAYPKLKKEIESSLRSFRLIPRTAAPAAAPAAAGTDSNAPAATSKAPTNAFERRVVRQAQEKELHDKALASVAEGWTAKRMGRFLVFNHGDERSAQRMVDNGEALLVWLEKTFPFIGPEEYVRAPILRICKNWDEETNLQRGSQWSWSNLEIITHDPRDDWVNWSFGSFNSRLFDLWFSERDADLYHAFPPWLSWGLREVASDAVVKNGKVEFKDDGWDRDQVREREREKLLRPPKELIQMTSSSFYDSNDWGTHHDAEALMRFLIGPAAQKNARTKDLLPNYVRNLRAVVDSYPKNEEQNAGSAPAKAPTEAEQAAAVKKWKDREQNITAEVFQRTFSTWTDKDWDEFEKVYFKAML